MPYIAYNTQGQQKTLSKGFSQSYFQNWLKKKGYTTTKPETTIPKKPTGGAVVTKTGQTGWTGGHMTAGWDKPQTTPTPTPNQGETPTPTPKTTPTGVTGYTPIPGVAGQGIPRTGTTPTGTGETTGTGDTGDGETKEVIDDNTDFINSLPDSIKNDPVFQSMSPDMQEAIAYNHYVQSQGAEEDIKAWNDALVSAQADADPYFKNLLRVTVDEVNRASTKLTGDYASRAQQLQDSLADIQADLTTNRAYLSLTEQADLKKLSQQYQVELENTQQTMAARGLTFSTSRATAESRLQQSQQGLVESTTRQYGYQMQKLEKEAARGNTTAQTQLDDLKRQLGYNRTALGRGFEQTWGTSSLPQLQGYSPLGGIVGTMAEEKTKDIASRRETIYDETTRASLSPIYSY